MLYSAVVLDQSKFDSSSILKSFSLISAWLIPLPNYCFDCETKIYFPAVLIRYWGYSIIIAQL